jgi:hypothetical protein
MCVCLTDGSREHEERHTYEEHVSEEEQSADELDHLQLGEEVDDGVEVEVEGRAARREVRPPPPVAVLVAQLEVDEHDGDDLGAVRRRRSRDECGHQHFSVASFCCCFSSLWR